MEKKRVFLILIILLEIFFIIYILKSLQDQGKFFLLIEPINKSQLTFTNEIEVKYFYEPAPNTEENYYSNIFKKSVIETTNNDSLFERYNYSIDKPKNVYRIVSLGDSYTQGLWVNISDNYSETLEDILNNYSKNCSSYQKFEVINLGVSGYDILYNTIRFKNRGLKYQPNLVIWFIKHDDFTIISEIYLNFTEDIQVPNKEDDPKGFVNFWEKEDQKFISLMKNFDEKFLNERYIIGPLSDFFEITKKEKIKVIIFTQFDDIGGDYDEMLEKIISDYSHVSYLRLGIDIDFYNENLSIFYSKENTGLSDPHPNEEGHKIIALGLIKFLKSEFLKNC